MSKKIKKILVSQPKPTSEKSPYFDIAARHGIEIVFRPFVRIEGLSAKEFRASKVNLGDFTAVIMNSRKAVDNFFRLCEETRVKVPDTMKYFCSSEAIAVYLQKYIVYRKRKIFFGLNGKLDDPQLTAAIAKHSKEKFLFPVSDANKETPAFIADLGLDCTKATMYRNVSNDFTPDEPFDYDVLIFFSPSGVQYLKKNFPDFDQEAQEVYIGALGPSTAHEVEAQGLKLDFAAPAPQAPSISAALDKFLTEHESDGEG